MDPTPYAVCVATSEQDAEKLQNFMHEQMGHTMPVSKPIERQQAPYIQYPRYVYVVWNCTDDEIMGIYWDEDAAEDAVEKLIERTMFTNYDIVVYEVK